MSRDTAEYKALLDLSAEVGSDPALVQAAGGNTSVKHDGTLWIKASGTWLMNALNQNIMVPVTLNPLLQALERQDPATEKAQSFVLKDLNPANLRPSIETTVHAVFPQSIVVHVHCVETIAVASRIDAVKVLTELLVDFNWRYVPYAKPGLDLSRLIAESLYEDKIASDVVILGNHGLVIAADTVGEARSLLYRVCRALKQPTRIAPIADTAVLQHLAANSHYELPDNIEAHAVATDKVSLAVAKGGSLYPDHVIFLGEGSVVAAENETPAQIEARYINNDLPAPVAIVFPGIGVLMKKGCGDGAHAMARCLSDVASRLSDDMVINYLTPAQNHELLNWDAEKYRQALNQENDTKSTVVMDD